MLSGPVIRVVPPNPYKKLNPYSSKPDDSRLKMGEYFDLVADRFGLARPLRVTRAGAQGRIDPGMLSFMGESRRLVNTRLKQEMGYCLRYPTVEQGLAAALPAPAP